MRNRERAALKLLTAASLGLSLGVQSVAAESTALSGTTNRVSKATKESQQVKVDTESGVSKQVKLSTQGKISTQGKVSSQTKLVNQVQSGRKGK
mgnify:CR=1 FL=1